MNITRLKRLIDIIAAIPKEQFNMGEWRTEKSCGTAACAVGWACLDQGFQGEGLQTRGDVHDYCPMFQGFTHYEAAAAFFGLSSHWTRYIFDPTKYDALEWDITPADVIRRIDQVIHGIAA